MEVPQQQLLFTAGALICAGIGSIHDVRERRIPNRVTGPALAAGLLLHAFLGGWPGLLDSMLAGLIAGGIFLLFYIAGGMGAGDVKLMAAVGCMAGLASLQMLVLSTVIAGAAFGLAVAGRNGKLRQTLRNVGTLLAHHRRQGAASHPSLNLMNADTLRLPFALPIASGCLFTLCTEAMKAGS